MRRNIVVGNKGTKIPITPIDTNNPPNAIKNIFFIFKISFNSLLKKTLKLLQDIYLYPINQIDKIARLENNYWQYKMTNLELVIFYHKLYYF